MLFEEIETLCKIPGISGNEEAVRYEILRRIEGKCIYKTDSLGNILAFKKGRQPAKNRLLFSAHMDEVGLIVTFLEEDGLLRFDTVGGIDLRTLAGRAVQVGPNAVPGAIGLKPTHLKSDTEREKAAPAKELAIDIGVKTRAEAQALVSPGDRVVFTARFTRMGEDFLCGRALDDRIGCVLLIRLIESDLAFDTHFAFTVQEETGTAGGKTAAAQIAPEIAVIVETTTAADLPDTPENRVVCKLGNGPVLSFSDKGTIYDSNLLRAAQRIAQQGQIPFQMKEGVFGGNEARSVQTAGNGARVLAVSVPCRYLHTPACMAKLSDIRESQQLLAALAGELAG